MVHQILIAEKNTHELVLPENFVGKKIEIIAFVVEDTAEQPMPTKPMIFDAIKIDTRGFKFDRDEANER